MAKCLENVSSQWIEGIEHIIVDGGSNDGTREILTDFGSRFSHIRWISEHDKGQSDAMNKGIKMAKGNWIGFLNVDDFYEGGALRLVMNHIKGFGDKNTILVGNLKIWNADGTFRNLNKPSGLSLPLLLADLCEWPYNPSAYFYPRAIHEQIGYFPDNEHFAMDYDFILKAAVSGIPFQYINETWGNFRLLPDSKTSRDQKDRSSYNRAQDLRNYYFKRVNFVQKIEVIFLKVKWYITLKWRYLFN
jgi:glycosyltransferase involved in cell wall biosynthesis